jgi:hypothetical protein
MSFTILLIFLLGGCSSNLEKMEKNFNEYGYELKIINEEFSDHFDDADTLVNIYGVYNSSNSRVARIYEFESESAIEEIIESEGEEKSTGITWYKNMLLFPEIPDPVRLVLIFYGHDPDEVLNR